MIKKVLTAAALVMTMGSVASANLLLNATPKQQDFISNQNVAAQYELADLLSEITGEEVGRAGVLKATAEVLGLTEAMVVYEFGHVNQGRGQPEHTRTLFNIIFAVDQAGDAFIAADLAAEKAEAAAEAAAVVAAEEAALAAEAEAAAQFEADEAGRRADAEAAKVALEAAEARQAELTAEIAAQTAAMIQAETDARVAIQTAINDAQASIVEKVNFLTGGDFRFEDLGTPLASLLNESDAYALTVEVYQGVDGIADVMDRLDFNVLVVDLGDGTSLVSQRHLSGVGAYVVTN